MFGKAISKNNISSYSFEFFWHALQYGRLHYTFWVTLYESNRYGLPFVSKNNILVSTINGTGAAIEIIYVLIFIAYSIKKERAKILGLFIFVLSVFGVVVFVSLFALHGHGRKLFCGLAATIFSIIMYASPLSIMVSSVYSLFL